MVRMLGCSVPLLPTPLLPALHSHPPSVLLNWKVRARPHSPNATSQAVIGFLACSSAPSLTSPSLSVNTFALWLAQCPGRHTPASACFGSEKAF
uniref:Secreted protein n=1 Tax=Knipowitschia caucasica TaxID=637954 RepID=A0AAV2KUM5_KNICA